MQGCWFFLYLKNKQPSDIGQFNKKKRKVNVALNVGANQPLNSDDDDDDFALY